MEHNHFNALHPTHSDRERGWYPAPNPFAPRKAVPGRTFIDKHIFIYSDQLFYLVDATTNLLSKARRNVQGSDSETLSTSENDGERPLFLHWFDKYLKNVETILTAYVMKPKKLTRDNVLKEWREKELWLKMPDYWDDTCFDGLVQAINRYISDGALLEYFKIRLSSKDPLTVDKTTDLADDELEIISLANMVKPGTIHKIPKPF